MHLIYIIKWPYTIIVISRNKKNENRIPDILIKYQSWLDFFCQLVVIYYLTIYRRPACSTNSELVSMYFFALGNQMERPTLVSPQSILAFETLGIRHHPVWIIFRTIKSSSTIWRGGIKAAGSRSIFYRGVAGEGTLNQGGLGARSPRISAEPFLRINATGNAVNSCLLHPSLEFSVTYNKKMG